MGNADEVYQIKINSQRWTVLGTIDITITNNVTDTNAYWLFVKKNINILNK